jgi:tetratricopeptide (TPR) repeat protein
MRRAALTLCVLVGVLLLAGQVLAATTLSVGRKNFERARRADLNGRVDEGREYFAKAADAFSELFAQRDAEGHDVFASELTMGGISLFKAGRLEEGAQVLEQVLDKNPDNYEAAIYAAMARARLGQTDRALALLGRYPVTAGQRRFTDVMHAIQARLRLGRISPQDAANELEDAQRDQDRWNIAHSLNLDIPFQDKCGASFWWRYADTPCNASAKPAGGVVW